MIDNLIFVLTFVSALGCGLMAGFFLAFSTGVMRALARLPPPQGLAAMQSINVTVLNPWFFAAFFGTAAVCVLLIVFSLLRWHRPGAVYLLVGSLLYLLGTMLVTIVFNVPRNEALAVIDPASPNAVSLWSSYLVSWTAWNHVRTVASLAAATTLTLALLLARDG